MSFPIVPQELLQELDRRFPDQCPDPSMSDRDIWIAVGARKVVNLLKREFDRQNDNILKR
jgi:hypothetical protein